MNALPVPMLNQVYDVGAFKRLKVPQEGPRAIPTTFFRPQEPPRVLQEAFKRHSEDFRGEDAIGNPFWTRFGPILGDPTNFVRRPQSFVVLPFST